MDIMKMFFEMMLVRHWNRLPRDEVDSTSLEAPNVRLDGAMSNLIEREVSVPIEEGWN